MDDDARFRRPDGTRRRLRPDRGFFFKAAADYNASQATGLDGALQKLAHAPYGTVILGIVAVGLFAFGLFCLIQARYREV